jgi:hypothetical protein
MDARLKTPEDPSGKAHRKPKPDAIRKRCPRTFVWFSGWTA